MRSVRKILLMMWMAERSWTYGLPSVGTSRSSSSSSSSRNIRQSNSESGSLHPTDTSKSSGRRERHVQLSFEGTYETKTDPIANVSTDQIMAFFKDPDHRDLLLKGGNNPTECLSMTPDLMGVWQKQSTVLGTLPPRQSDPIIAIRSSVNLIPGLKINAVSYMGCKFLQDPITALPIYEFTLVFDEYAATGLKPLVWMFNQITGEDSSNESSRATQAVSRISMVSGNEERRSWPSFQKKHESLSMKYYGLVRVSCSIPKGLLRILPFSTQKVQQKVSVAMGKQLEREGTKSMDKVKLAFTDWLKRQPPKEPIKPPMFF